MALAAGLPVQDGFCVSTSAYSAAAEQAPALAAVVDELAAASLGETSRLAQLAGSEASSASRRLALTWLAS